MAFRRWLGALKSKFLGTGSQKPAKRRNLPFRPQIEQLEAREMMSVGFQFDYSLDTNGFFNDPARRAALETAGRMITNQLGDTLAAIQPGGTNTWSAIFQNPATGANITRSNMTVGADTILVFAGGRDLAGELGFGGPGGYSGSGDANWLNTLKARGETGALASSPTDVAPAIGQITFDTFGPNWNFSTTNGPGAGQSDFLSVALHELAHVLGIGTSAPWRSLASSGVFTGAAATASFGRNVPVDPTRAHWADGTMSGGNEAALDPILTTGTRKLFTPLDFAGLRDIGWEVIQPGQPPPPSTNTAIDQKYASLGGMNSILGSPIGAEGVTADGVGRFRHFQRGSIYWHPNTGAREIHGTIREKWFAMGAERSILGYPTSDELANPDGRGRYSWFQRGVIQWSAQTGANEIHGAILQRYLAVSSYAGPLGYAISDEMAGGVNGSRVSRFERGVIYWSPGTGAQEVYGVILQRYNALGAERGPLGLPTSGEHNGVISGVRLNRFQNGAIYWSQATGAQEVYGMIYQRYVALGAERSVLGLPTSGELSNNDGRGRYNWFQRGVIQWSPQTGANEIYGAILAKYLTLGSFRSALGYAVTGERSTPDGRGRYNHFEGGSIYWTPQTGAFEVRGAIRGLWSSLGWERSWLGYPTSDEFAISGGRRSNFQFGYIVWTSSGGARAFRY